MLGGGLNAINGVAGFGCYHVVFGDKKEAFKYEVLTKAWNHTVSGAYGIGGCLIGSKRHGIVVTAMDKQDTPVPAGASAYHKDQIACHPRVLEYINFTCVLDSFCFMLQDNLAEAGYSYELHKALCSIQKYE